jgi:hypothetical protein
MAALTVLCVQISFVCIVRTKVGRARCTTTLRGLTETDHTRIDMAEKLNTTRRAFLSGLAALPIAAMPAALLAEPWKRDCSVSVALYGALQDWQVANRTFLKLQRQNVPWTVHDHGSPTWEALQAQSHAFNRLLDALAAESFESGAV